MSELHIPDVTGMDPQEAALAYTDAGWFITPVKPGTKHPGSVVGDRWQEKSSKDYQQIVDWWIDNPDYGIALHVGRSGAVAYDVDKPDAVLHDMHVELDRTVFQTTDPGNPDRGHYVFRNDTGRKLGNTSKGALPWGEVRGENGVIIVQPSVHQRADDGARYRWERTGPLAPVPSWMADQIKDHGSAVVDATDEDVVQFCRVYDVNEHPEELDTIIEEYRDAVKRGFSRHEKVFSKLGKALVYAGNWNFPAQVAIDRLAVEFAASVAGDSNAHYRISTEWPRMVRDSVARRREDELPQVSQGTAVKGNWSNRRAGESIKVEARARAVLRQSRTATRAVPRQTEGDGTDSGRFFDKTTGLRVAALADEVLQHGPLALGTDDRMWRYEHGVWTPDKNVVRHRVARILGDRSRRAHATNTEDMVRARVVTITSEPVSEFINFRNGLLDWRSGVLHPHTPEVLSTVQLTVDWIPDAQCAVFDGWLAQVVPGDCLGMVWELLGYLLYSGNPLQKAIMLVGSGGNGKGTLLRVVTAILGSRNITAVSLHDLISTRFSTASLFGKIANIAGDIDGKFLDSTAAFKAITGQDVISAEHKGLDRFDFTPWAVPVFSANKIPASADTTAGYLRRWLIVPFPHSFVGREDRGLEGKLHAELPGIAAKAVRALPGLLARGEFPLPAIAADARRDFERQVDQVRMWMDECTQADSTAWEDRRDLFGAYRLWAEQDGYRAVKASEFYTRLDTAGVSRATRQGKRGFRIRLTDSRGYCRGTER